MRALEMPAGVLYPFSMFDADIAVVGSGFGGSVAALRFAEKGYRVVVLEKGRAFREEDFPGSNWNLPRWLWMPRLGFHGPFALHFFRHVTVLSGVGVGGGSLVYAAVLEEPSLPFFRHPAWRDLDNWAEVLRPHYATARRMLGAAPTPHEGPADRALRELARRLGREEAYRTTRVGLSFGQPVVGKARTVCVFCGGCMLGCRYGAKNTLDANYLYLAQQRGVRILPRHEVRAIRPVKEGREGYALLVKTPRGEEVIRTRGVVLAAGVLGTVRLLLVMKREGYPLPPEVGRNVRTNSESLIGIMTRPGMGDFSGGVAIGSILKLGDDRHMEAVRYTRTSGFWRLLGAPLAEGPLLKRLGLALFWPLLWPRAFLHSLWPWPWGERFVILLYMRVEGDATLALDLRGHRLVTRVERGDPPTTRLKEARDLARMYAEIVGGMPFVLFTESLLDIPTTAHILGGAPMGKVVDARLRLPTLPNFWIMDGSVIPANPGVNPSLTITALAEHGAHHARLETPERRV